MADSPSWKSWQYEGKELLMTLHFDYHSRWCLGNNQSVGSLVPVVSRWLGPGNRTFLEVNIAWWLVGG